MYTLTFFVVLCLTVTATPAPNAGTNINKEYVLQYFSKINWFLSFLSCQRNGMRLATINSEAEEGRLKNLIEKTGLKNEHFWLSATDLGHEGRFAWYSTGELVEYTNFRASQPDNWNKKEHCIEFSYFGLWNDASCDLLNYYVCEKLLS